MSKKFNYFFYTLSILYLTVELLNLLEIKFFMKPVLLLSLSIYFYWQVKNLSNFFSNFIQLGLFLSLLGDIALLFADKKELFFIVGLVLFLLAHVAYIISFRSRSSAATIEVSRVQLLFATIPFLSASLIVFFVLRSHLGSLLIPVIAYISVITAMGIAAAFRYKKTSQKSFSSILTGAVFFMISDTLLAFNKFYANFSFAGVLIMCSYIIAQYLIVAGSISHLKKQS